MRVWFFWLDLDISRKDLGQYWSREQDELEKAWRGITDKAAGGLAERSWCEMHEIPDAERVDIVFSDDLQPLYAAVDLHWREMWGEYAPENIGDPLEVQIMNTKIKKLAKNWQEMKEVIEGWATIILSRFARNTPPYKPHEEVMSELMEVGVLGADPIGMESHSPALFNVKVQRHLTSTDVTEG